MSVDSFWKADVNLEVNFHIQLSNIWLRERIESCHNEHPRNNSSSTRNPFAALQNNQPNASRSGPFGRGSAPGPAPGAGTLENSYKIDKSIITKDLTEDRPSYILSAYGPGRDAPEQLFGGQPREQSFEELRLRHYEVAAAGNEAQAIQEAQTLYSNADQQIQTALSDVNGAIKYIVDATNRHPNRLDVCRAKGGDPLQPSAGFQSGSGAFGGPPTFGQPSAPSSAFGQPATLGPKPATFGQPSNLGPTPAFGQTSAPSGFNKPLQNPTPFGSQQAQPTFGQPSNPFSQQPASTQPSSAFGPPQQASAAPSIFSSTATTSSSFGQSLAAPSTTFGQPSALQQPSVFGKPSTVQPNVNPFGSTAPTQNSGGFSQTTTVPSTGFGQATAPAPTSGAFGRPSAPAPAAGGGLSQSGFQGSNSGSSNATFGPGKPDERKLQTWNGQPVTYVDDFPCIKNAGDGGLQRIFFPEGPPKLTNKTQEYPEGFVIDDAARKNFEHFLQHGLGADGMIPEMPPPRDMVNWNF